MAVEIDDTNRAPKFADLDDKMDGDQTDQEREIAENTATGTALGSDRRSRNSDRPQHGHLDLLAGRD